MSMIVKPFEGLVIIFDFHDFFNYVAEMSTVMFHNGPDVCLLASLIHNLYFRVFPTSGLAGFALL